MALDYDLLRRLVEAPGLSGQEGAVRAVLREALAPLGPEITTDPLGNLIAHWPGEGPRLLLDAHMDEVGLMVRHIDEAGLIRVIPVGGIDPRVLYGQRVVVWGRSALPGVIGAVPPHLLSAEANQKDKVVPVEELFVDLGLPSEEVAAMVRPGDAVLFPDGWVENVHSLQAKALDDRVGLFVMVEAIRRAERAKCDLYLTASVQEEVGLRGAEPLTRRLNPDLALALEGTVANDLPGVPGHKVLARLGHGPELRLSDARFLADRDWCEFIAGLAREQGLPYQVTVKKVGGTNASALQIAASGARAAALSVPVRYIHAPVGLARKADLDAAVALLAETLRQIERFSPEEN